MTNIHWGGRTRLSGMVCSATLLLTLIVFSLLLERIPIAVLSGILIKVALDIIDWRYLRRFRTAPRTGLTLMFTVMGLLAKALKPFQQINAETDTHGTGLGLPLTMAMVEANRARFQIESQPNQGTLVEIYFPTQRVLADR